jgi:Fe-S-cluster containining protein
MSPSDLASAVMAAAERPAVAGAVAELYADLEAEIARRRPLCVMSGRCCRFDEYGHRLFVTTMELAAFVRNHRPASAGLAAVPGGCPFQKDKLCTVHPIRPMGCRLFFCDSSATEWQNQKYEEFHARLRQLHQSLNVPYAYLEWRTALKTAGLTQ